MSSPLASHNPDSRFGQAQILCKKIPCDMLDGRSGAPGLSWVSSGQAAWRNWGRGGEGPPSRRGRQLERRNTLPSHAGGSTPLKVGVGDRERPSPTCILIPGTQDKMRNDEGEIVDLYIPRKW